MPDMFCPSDAILAPGRVCLVGYDWKGVRRKGEAKRWAIIRGHDCSATTGSKQVLGENHGMDIAKSGPTSRSPNRVRCGQILQENQKKSKRMPMVGIA
jgi:hypothetical protein